MRGLIGIMVLSVACMGCATKQLYHWGSYEDDLYATYKSPENGKEFQETLRQIIDKSEKRGQTVPPGICAEYGFCLYTEGRLDEAVGWFEKEREAWPEAAVLMNTLIRNVSQLRGDEPVDKEEGSSPSSPVSKD